MADGDLLRYPLQQFPLGVPSWDSFRRDNLFFVDKTALLGSLVTSFRRVFISRPRRMGKTTLCSTLAELFAHGDSDKFAGTAIHGKWPVKECYPVIYLAFYSMNCTNAAAFEADLCQKILEAYYDAGFKEAFNSRFAADVSSFSFVKRILKYLTGKQPLVFLIDEWDDPISKNLDKPQLVTALKEVLSRFYGWLREQTQSRFILVTGIMRYHDTSLFTGYDFDDLSMEPRYAKLMGYTQEELESDIFKPYMARAAARMGITEQELLEQLKRHYDGFCFDEDAAVKVYCPYSINKFFFPLADPVFLNDPNWVPEFNDFWMKSANASASLKSYLHTHSMSKQELIELSKQQFEMSHSDLQSILYLHQVTLHQLLVQGGYFSIQAITADTMGKPADERCYVCGVTNYEISKKFVEVLTEHLVSFPTNKELAKALAQVKDDLLAGDMAKLCASFNQVLAHGRYDVYSAMEALAAKGKQPAQEEGSEQEENTDTKQGQEQTQDPQPEQAQAQNLVIAPEPEVFYRTLLMLSLSSFHINVEDEVANNHGRCDLVAFTNDHTYIFELKRLNKDSNSLQDKIARIQDAKQQMLDKHYGNNLKEEGKPITMVVLVICDSSRQICAWHSFKVKDPLVNPVAVDNQGELIDFETQTTSDLNLGIIESQDAEAQEQVQQKPKAKRSTAPKASAAKAQEQVLQKPKAKRSTAAKASAAKAQELVLQKPKAKRSTAAKASAAKAQEQVLQKPKAKRSTAPKASAAKAKEPVLKKPKAKRSTAPKASAAKAKEPVLKKPKAKRSTAAKQTDKEAKS